MSAVSGEHSYATRRIHQSASEVVGVEVGGGSVSPMSQAIEIEPIFSSYETSKQVKFHIF